MEEGEDISSPFWLQSTRQAGHRRRRFSSSFLFNSGALLVFLLAVAVAFIFIVVPAIQSFTSQVFKPHGVKKSWDSLNFVLVLFAIICGFLSRNNNNNNNNNNESIATTPTTTSDAVSAAYADGECKFENRSESFQNSNPETPRRFWYDHAYNNNNNNNSNGGLSRLRSFSSHPDLRQEEALWANIEDQWRFYDDTHLYHNRFSGFDYKQPHQWQPQPQPKLEVLEEAKEKKENEKVDVVKNVDADNATSSTVEESLKEIIYTPPQPPPASPSPEPSELPPSPSPSPPPPLPPPQTKVVRRRVKRTHQENGGNYRKNDLEVKPPPPPPPQRQPRPPPAPPEPEVEESGGKSEKKRGGASATKEFLTSLKGKKKKKQRQKSVENLDSFFDYESSYPLPPSLIPPPPPPPPPPQPFFQNIFSLKKRKAKKIHSVIPSPPPPPPPLPARTQKLSTSTTRNAQSTSQKPSSPVKIKSYSNVEQNVNSGNESPLNAIPPPPPLPPFKMPAWKFEVHGDFVRLKSNNIGADDVDESFCPSDGGDSPVVTPMFCPSPDVNAKADNFIARFRAGLRLEKMNSVKEKEGRRRSNLGPEPSPAQEGGSPS